MSAEQITEGGPDIGSGGRLTYITVETVAESEERGADDDAAGLGEHGGCGAGETKARGGLTTHATVAERQGQSEALCCCFTQSRRRL